MSAPEPGLMSAPPPVANSHPMIHSMQLSFNPADGTTVYMPVSGNSLPFHSAKPAGNGNGGGGGEGINVNVASGAEQAKKKRGRPRKYDGGALPVPFAAAAPPVSMIPPQQQHQQHQWTPQQHQLHPQHQQEQQPPPQHQQKQEQQALQHQQKQEQLSQQQLSQQQQQQQQHVLQPHQKQEAAGGVGRPDSPVKKARGRPPGSINKKKQEQQQQLDAMGSPGIGFTPHVITVNSGEDISSKIMSFSQNGPRAICILSATGTISSVTLRQASNSGSSVTYEGYFEILSLSGSFMLSENGGGRSRNGCLSVSLACPDGRVFGGAVAGLLTAASPVQLVVGSFIPEGRKETKIPNQTEPLFSASKLHAATGQPATNSPPSRGTFSESSGGPGSPLNQSAAAVNSTPQGMSNLPWK